MPPIESTPTVETPAPKVTTAQVPRVYVAQNTGSQKRNSATPNYISQDEDDDDDDTSRYPRRIHQAVAQALMANELSYEVAMMANETSNNTVKLNSGISWLGEMANSVIGKDGTILEYRHLIADPATRAVWQRSFGNKIGRLAQGMPGWVTGTKIQSSSFDEQTYVGYVAHYRPEKEEKERL